MFLFPYSHFKILTLLSVENLLFMQDNPAASKASNKPSLKPSKPSESQATFNTLTKQQ